MSPACARLIGWGTDAHDAHVFCAARDARDACDAFSYCS